MAATTDPARDVAHDEEITVQARRRDDGQLLAQAAQRLQVGAEIALPQSAFAKAVQVTHMVHTGA